MLHERGERGRLLLEDVESGAAAAAVAERGQQVGLVDDAAARAVDELEAALAGAEDGAADEVVGGGEEGHVDGDVVGERPDVGHLHQLDAPLLGVCARYLCGVGKVALTLCFTAP